VARVSYWKGLHADILSIYTSFSVWAKCSQWIFRVVHPGSATVKNYLFAPTAKLQLNCECCERVSQTAAAAAAATAARDTVAAVEAPIDTGY